MRVVKRPGGDLKGADAEALLGEAPKPMAAKTVSKAFRLYLEEIAFDEQYNRLPKQQYSWEKARRTPVS